MFRAARTCETRIAVRCNASLGAKGTSRTPSQELTCATAEATESCTSYLNGTVPSACAPKPGPSAAGATCSYDAQCASAYCALPAAGECGTCEPPPEAGDSCANLDSCGPAFTCYHGTCEAYVASGGTCSRTDPCGAGLSCVTAKDATSGTCQAEGTTVGAACDPTMETGASCDATQELYCVHVKTAEGFHTCQKSSLATAGQACGDVAGVATLCADASTCVRPRATAERRGRAWRAPRTAPTATRSPVPRALRRRAASGRCSTAARAASARCRGRRAAPDGTSP